MTIESMALSALISSVAGAAGYLAWRRHRVPACCGSGVLRLVNTYLVGRASVARERQHHTMVLTAIAKLPPGALLVDQRRDGALRIQLALLPADHVGETSPVAQADHRPQFSAVPAHAGTKPSAAHPTVTHRDEAWHGG
jgi:Flp pilus assembly protein CpaB